jgi:hypothetical protein
MNYSENFAVFDLVFNVLRILVYHDEIIAQGVLYLLRY